MQSFLGVHIAAGHAYLGVVVCPDVMKLDDTTQSMQLSQHLAPAEALLDLKDRFSEELRRIMPASLGVVHPRLYAGWKYSEAVLRVSLESALMMAAAEEQIVYESIKQERIAKAFGAPLGNTFSKQAATKLGIKPVPIGWSQRALAFGAALVLARGTCKE